MTVQEFIDVLVKQQPDEEVRKYADLVFYVEKSGSTNWAGEITDMGESRFDRSINIKLTQEEEE